MRENWRFFKIYSALLLFWATSINFGFSQSTTILQNAKWQFGTNGFVPDSTINKLILMHNNPLTNDSTRVEIIYFFGEYSCESCLSHIIENIKSRYSYGDGISDIDQEKQTAAFSVLRNIAKSQNRWMILQPLLNSLKWNARNENFLLRLKKVMCYISTESIAKSILEFEIQESIRQMTAPGYSVYHENLILMLKQFK